MRGMTATLEGITIGVTERRYVREFSTMLERLGAHLDVVPLLEERLPDDRREIHRFIDTLIAGSLDYVIFTTGVGYRFLAGEAEAIAKRDAFIRALQQTTIVARGPKSSTALRRDGLAPAIQPDVETTPGIIESLRQVSLAGKHVGVQLYGTPNPVLSDALESMGATVVTVQPYTYAPVAEKPAVLDFVRRVIAGRVNVIAFTSAPQIRMLIQTAAEAALDSDLILALRNRVTVAAIGEVTCRALDEIQVQPAIVPPVHKMGPMVNAIADHFRSAS